MHQKQEDNWISFSDIMTGLMVIFLFISISYMLEVRKEKEERDRTFTEFKETKESLYKELDSIFNKDFENWQVSLDRDLSIKFLNPEVLFASGQSQITEKFKSILTDFFPRYLQIVLQQKYADKIAEIRIEGHTDDMPRNISNDSYIDNIELSQNRSREVLRFVRKLPCYEQLITSDKERLQFWLTANGLSFGRTLDNDKNLTAFSKQPINREFSRRVEFRIVTTSEKLVEKVINELNK